jgi:hypothetical protein
MTNALTAYGSMAYEADRIRPQILFFATKKAAFANVRTDESAHRAVCEIADENEISSLSAASRY